VAGSLEHKRWQRDDAVAEKNSGDLSSLREQRREGERERELGSEGERGGGGRGCPRVYREAGGGIGEGNNQQLIAMTPLMAGGRVKRV
jgi:hypothetical protein